jgi:hypothetical protein
MEHGFEFHLNFSFLQTRVLPNFGLESLPSGVSRGDFASYENAKHFHNSQNPLRLNNNDIY